MNITTCHQSPSPEISPETIKTLVADMNRTGFAVLPAFLAPSLLEDLVRFVEAAVAKAGGEYVALIGENAVRGTILAKLSGSPSFADLLHHLYEEGLGRPAPDQSLFQILRCLKGTSGLGHSLRFHYDSYVVTALLPVIIPATGRAGHLVMAPNGRPVRSSYFLNLLDKLKL